MGREAHPDPDRRYMAAAANGVLYCIVGTFGAAVAGLLDAFPRELVFAVAGLALVGTIAGGLSGALAEPAQREPALVTFLVTLSGVTFLGVGSALWGLVAGAVALFVQKWRPRRRTDAGRTDASP
jgi:benzoate membrane transport protein